MIGLQLRALGRSVCFPSCRAALSLVARSLLRFGSPCDAVLLGVFYSTVKTFQCDGLAG